MDDSPFDFMTRAWKRVGSPGTSAAFVGSSSGRSNSGGAGAVVGGSDKLCCSFAPRRTIVYALTNSPTPLCSLVCPRANGITGTPVELKWQYADGDAIDLADPTDVTILKKMAYTNLISGLPYVLLRCCEVEEDWNMLRIQSKMTSISLPAPDGG